MAEATPRPTAAGPELEPQPCPAALTDPSQHGAKPFTFGFSSGRHPHIRRLMELVESALTRTVYPPFMRFAPPVVDRVNVPVPGLPADLDGLTIVQISDLHHSPIVPLSVIEGAVALANGLRPDAIVLTGDYVSNDVRYAAACARALARLTAPLGVFAILGNHDYWTDPQVVLHELEQNGITVLVNQARLLRGNLWLVGMDDIWSGRPDLDKAMAAVPSGGTTLLLAHEPDYADRTRGRGIALQISGHSHGGQVRMPFTGQPILPTLSWRYYAGLQQAEGSLLYTNRGVGTIQPPFIFTCRPEIALLRLCRA